MIKLAVHAPSQHQQGVKGPSSRLTTCLTNLEIMAKVGLCDWCRFLHYTKMPFIHGFFILSGTNECIQIIFVDFETNECNIIFIDLGQKSMNIWAVRFDFDRPIYSLVTWGAGLPLRRLYSEFGNRVFSFLSSPRHFNSFNHGN
jgi:hypothetical protein